MPKNTPKLVKPRWQDVGNLASCNHDFVKLPNARGGRPFANGMSRYRCRLCGFKKVARG